MKRFLVFKSTDTCYGSFLYFADCVTNELRELGHHVDVCQYSKDNLDTLEEYIGKSYDAMIDFNSLLPTARMDDNSYFLDHIDAEFYNYILDHPLYHQVTLKEPIKHYHVLCLDEDHVRYITRYYKHIQSVHLLPIGAYDNRSDLEMKDRKYSLLFPATYTNPEAIITMIEACSSDVKANLYAMIDRMKAEPSKTVDQVLASVLQEQGFSPKEENMPALLNLHFLADMYMRAYVRDQVIRGLLDQNISVTVMGHDWKKFKHKNSDKLTILDSVGFAESFEYMKQAKVVLNVMPLFKAGFHDRIAGSMLSNSVCLTDSSEYLEKHVPKEQVLYYEIGKFEKLENVFLEEETLARIANRGYEAAMQQFTWRARMESFLSFL